MKGDKHDAARRFTPLRDKVLLRGVITRGVTPAGVIYPDEVRYDKDREWVVLRVGSSVRGVKEGDRVLTGKMPGGPRAVICLVHGGPRYRLIPEDLILALVEVPQKETPL